MVDSWDHLEAKILIPKRWGRLHKNVQTTDYCRMENTIALTAESYFLFYIDPSIDIDIIALYAGLLMRYILSIGECNAPIGKLKSFVAPKLHFPQHFGIKIFVSKWSQESTINGWFVKFGTPSIKKKNNKIKILGYYPNYLYDMEPDKITSFVATS